MTAIEAAVDYALSRPRPFTTRQVSRVAKLNVTTTGHVLRTLCAVGLIVDAGRRGWRPKPVQEPPHD